MELSQSTAEKTIHELVLNQVKPSESYNYTAPDEVELTEEEIEKAISKLKREKAAKLNERAYWDKVNKPIEFPVISAGQLGSMAVKVAKEHIPNFSIDDQNRDIFRLLCQYFTHDPEFEEAGYSLKKGLLLFGPVGCGKTTLMRLFQNNPTNGFSVKASSDVADEYANTKKSNDGGVESIAKYSRLIEVYPNENFGQSLIGYCFDDLGTEGVKKHFGNELNVMEDLIQKRYNMNYGNKTHFTTNLSGEEIDQYYGPRVRSRLREMCNIISFNEYADDRRK